MAYQSGIPEATDRKNASQSAIKDNFGALKTAFETNHGAFNGGIQGKHTIVALPQQTTSGTVPPATSATEMSIYCKTNGASPALWIRPTGQAAGLQTPDLDIDFTTYGDTATGWSRLPSGLIIKWGTGTVGAANAEGTAIYDSTVPFSNFFIALISREGNLADAGAFWIKEGQSVANKKLQLTVCNVSGKNPANFYYLAIGN